MELLRKIVLEHILELENKKDRDENKLKRYYLISRLLEDDACFFKISKEDSYQILSHLGIQDPHRYYKKLISPESYSMVKDYFKMDENSN